ncbi:HvfC/BufC N-terminal domain-containing protein, partial [Puniceibacterium confluentis]
MTSQSAFHAALLDAATAVPAGLTDGNGHSAGRRYAVYRNNVAVSLRDALETGYPAIARLLGRENFRHVAGLHLRASPPETPCMMLYGADFPDFLASLAPLAHLPYLADVARIEWGLRCAYHAADSTP